MFSAGRALQTKRNVEGSACGAAHNGGVASAAKQACNAYEATQTRDSRENAANIARRPSAGHALDDSAPISDETISQQLFATRKDANTSLDPKAPTAASSGSGEDAGGDGAALSIHVVPPGAASSRTGGVELAAVRSVRFPETEGGCTRERGESASDGAVPVRE